MGVLYAKVDGVWVPVGTDPPSPNDHPPAYIGPRKDAPTDQALFGYDAHGGDIGFSVSPAGTMQVIAGNAQSSAFYEAQGPNEAPTSYTLLARVYRVPNGGAFEVGGMKMGRHPNLGNATASIWQAGNESNTAYHLLLNSVDGSATLNGATVTIRQAGADRMNFWGTHTEFVNLPVRLANTTVRTVNLGIGDGEPTNGAYSQAHLYVSSTTTQARIGLRGGNYSNQIRCHSGDTGSVAAVNTDNTGFVAFKGLAYINASSATIKRKIRTLRPQRERIVVRRDPWSDTVEPPDIMALRPVVYRPKVAATMLDDDGNSITAPLDTVIGKEGHRERLGLIAEDVQYVIPSAVAHAPDGAAGGVMYDQITVALLDHVQRLTQTVETLQYRIAELEARP